ncbi:MAG: DUF481 domain-containing protein [Verrucomicrobiota bacterium]
MKWWVLLFLLGVVSLPAAVSAIGTGGQLERVQKHRSRVAVPGHDDQHEWTSSFDLGASLAKGNSDALFLTASLTIDKEFGDDEIFGNFTYAYGEDNRETTTDELLATASWARLLKDNWYFGFRLDGRYDQLANIDYRVATTGYGGKYLLKSEDTQLSFEAGVGYTFEKQGMPDDYFTLYAGERFNHWFNDYVRLYQSVAFFAAAEEPADYQMISDLGLETFLSASLSFKVYAQNKYESRPAAGSQENDFKLVSGISWKF